MEVHNSTLTSYDSFIRTFPFNFLISVSRQHLPFFPVPHKQMRKTPSPAHSGCSIRSVLVGVFFTSLTNQLQLLLIKFKPLILNTCG